MMAPKRVVIGGCLVAAATAATAAAATAPTATAAAGGLSRVGSGLGQDVGPMNQHGLYTIANAVDNTTSRPYNGEFFELLSDPQRSQYSEVVWHPMSQELPADIVQRFNGKVMVVTGYEADIVAGDSVDNVTSVPCTRQYNHHYSAYMCGKLSSCSSAAAEQVRIYHLSNGLTSMSVATAEVHSLPRAAGGSSCGPCTHGSRCRTTVVFDRPTLFAVVTALSPPSFAFPTAFLPSCTGTDPHAPFCHRWAWRARPYGGRERARVL
jgi:hypothetical protein